MEAIHLKESIYNHCVYHHRVFGSRFCIPCLPVKIYLAVSDTGILKIQHQRPCRRALYNTSKPGTRSENLYSAMASLYTRLVFLELIGPTDKLTIV